jgi:hypothetical protein
MSNGAPHINDLISALHDGELAGHEREAAEQLLEESADSRAELEDYRALSELLRELPAVSAPDGMRAAVMRQIEREQPPAPVASPALRRQRPWRFRIGIIASMLTAAAALLVIFARPDRPKHAPTLASASNGGETPPSSRVDEDALVARTDMFRQKEMRDLAERTGDMPARSNWFDALGSTGGLAAASSAAQPPKGFSIGDVYTYLEQTPAGDVMVVSAVVVDVRRAADKLQVLLSQHQIPTVSVAVHDEAAGGFGGGAAGRAAPADSAEQDVALYVESDPDRMNAALAGLDDEEGFLSWKYAGVLDQNEPQIAQSSTFGSAGDKSLPALNKAIGAESERFLQLEPKGNSAAGAQVRGSIPDRGYGRTAGARREILQRNEGKGIPLPPQAEGAELAETEGSQKKQENETLADLSNGYQTILQVPRVELQQRLAVHNDNSPAKSGADVGRTNLYFYSADPEAPGDTKLAQESLKETEPQQLDRAMHLEKTPAEAPRKQQQRRLRLLVVLEPEAIAAKAVKAGVDAPPAPVEAPSPKGKKG